MKTETTTLEWLDHHQSHFTAMADEIWANPEIRFEEFKASKLQSDYLEEAGFAITWDVGDISTAFMAEWGNGEPVIGFAGEYDALPGLSQKLQSRPEALEAGGHGHGCGHNLLGTGCLAAAVAVKQWLQTTGTAGTVRYYGCPAEEGGAGKVMSQAAIELYASPDKLRAVRQEFERATAVTPYVCPIPADKRPPQKKHPYR